MRDLIEAAESGSDARLEELFRTRGSFLARSHMHDGRTLLHVAGSRAVAELLAVYGANVTARSHAPGVTRGDTPLHAAIRRRRIEVAEWLIARGADTNAANEAGWTPRHLAVVNGEPELTRTLLLNGARADARTTLETPRAPAGALPIDLARDVMARRDDGRLVEPATMDVLVRMLGGIHARRSPAAVSVAPRSSLTRRVVERLSRIAAAWF